MADKLLDFVNSWETDSILGMAVRVADFLLNYWELSPTQLYEVEVTLWADGFEINGDSDRQFVWTDPRVYRNRSIW